MSNLRFIFKLITAYIARFKLIIGIGGLLGVILFVFGSRIASSVLETDTQKIGIVGRYTPEILPQEVSNLLTRKLIKISENGTPEPDLAVEWETPDKGKTWTVRLGDASWQDGTVVSADSIKLSFEDVEIVIPDQKTITFKLKDPFIPFPTALTRPLFKQGLLGTEDWKVKNITLTGNYIKQMELINSQEKSVKIYKFYPTLEQAKLAFKLGKINEIHNVIDPSPFNEWSVIDVSQNINKRQVVTVFFNTKDDQLKDKSFRQALYYAIDKDSLGERAISPISPESWAYNPQVKPYDYDPERSREIIGEFSPETKANLSLKLTTSPFLLSTAEKIAKNWNDIGVETVVQVSSITPTEFQAFVAIYDIPSDPDQYAIWHSIQTENNISQYGNPRIDKLLEDGRVTIDIQERRKLYLDFQRFLLEDAPAAFLYFPTYYSIVRK